MLSKIEMIQKLAFRQLNSRHYCTQFWLIHSTASTTKQHHAIVMTSPICSIYHCERYMPFSRTILGKCSLHSVESFRQWSTRRTHLKLCFDTNKAALPRDALLQDLECYEAEVIAPLGSTPEALAWYKLRNNVNRAGDQLFDFFPRNNYAPWPVPVSFKEFRSGQENKGIGYHHSFDSVIRAYDHCLESSRLHRLHMAFRVVVADWTEGDRQSFCGLPHNDRLVHLLRTLDSYFDKGILNHFYHDKNVFEKVLKVTQPARDFLELARKNQFCPSRKQLVWMREMLDGLHKDTFTVGYPKPDWSQLAEFEDPTIVGFECDELAWEVRPGFATPTLVSFKKCSGTL
jgi:hypothetical protein